MVFVEARLLVDRVKVMMSLRPPPPPLRVALLLSVALSIAACDETAEMDTWGGDDDSRSASLAAEPDAQASHNVNKIGTNNSGAAYKAECSANSVPVPAKVLDPADSRWQNHGVLANPILNPTLDAELWTYQDGLGLCMALPRWNSENKAEFLGLICVGRTTGISCFWDNPNGTKFSRNIDSFVGGFALEVNGQGRCTKCHVGENPFVVHPYDAPFANAKAAVSSFHGAYWYSPIAANLASWPGNRGPLESLGLVTEGQKQCTTCHHKDDAGRLPLVSNDFVSGTEKPDGFCDVVLPSAIGTADWSTPTGPLPPTMPPEDPGDGDDLYADHIAWLDFACGQYPGQGGHIPFSPPPNIPVLPPYVVPPYECSKHVTVLGARLDATLQLYVAGAPAGTAVMRNPEGHVFTLTTPLAEGQLVEATQKVGTVTSAKASATVLEAPDDLPAPVITPTPIYKCATAIAFTNVPGATVQVEKDPVTGSTTTHTRTSGAGHTWFGELGPAFAKGDAFRVRQRLCSDDPWSPWSSGAAAQDPPSPLPQVTFVPPYVSQKVLTLEGIVQGSEVTLREQVEGVIKASPSVPYTVWRNIDLQATPLGPVISTDRLKAQQKLCGMMSTMPSFPPTALPCTQQPLPEIAQPNEGDDFVLVTRGVPGATIRVFDATTEIGNGTGSVIPLTRALVANELIKVHQKLDGCSVNWAFSVTVHPN